MRGLLLVVAFATTLFAKGNISVEEILKTNFSSDLVIEKKSIILTKKEAQAIQQKARAKLNSKIVRLYNLKKENTLVGYGVLLKRRIRTKNAAVLYMIDNSKKLKSIEILSFSEPREYKPNKKWQAVFTGKSGKDMIISGKDIPTISGATMSARALSDAARIALAVIEVKAP
ncbi:MAG: FMN-binding protein [Epsilonproteobacteria bacterium]|nr:FMN-binding protein [Campylobacterota bacterium]